MLKKTSGTLPDFFTKLFAMPTATKMMFKRIELELKKAKTLDEASAHSPDNKGPKRLGDW